MDTMDTLALRAQTDKASDGHNYTKVYESYLEKYRQDPLLIVELGIGGYHYPDRGGQSLRLWEAYFPNARIVGVDIYDKPGMGSDRVTIVKGGQDDAEIMTSIVGPLGQPDLVIDDASHQCDLTIKAFETWFPALKPGGLYFCEDVHTSFWFEYKGDPDPAAPGTTLKYFQELTPQLSHDSMKPEYRNQFAGYIDFIHFYRNLVIIKKL